MQPLPVVDELDVIEQRRPGLLAASKVAVMHQLILEVREETLRD